MLGEENDYQFAKNLVVDLIQCWNDNIKQLRDDFSESMRASALEAVEKDPRSQCEDVQRAMCAQTRSLLKETLDDMQTIVISQTPLALKLLGNS